MAKRYEVLERSFINGRLYEPGETVVLEVDSPGSNLKPVNGKAAVPTSNQGDNHQDGEYVAARGAAGKFVVKDAGGAVLFSGTKAEAEAEAARLNAGLGQAGSGDNQDGGDQGEGNGLPDA